MNSKDERRFRTLDNWSKLSDSELQENRRRGLQENDALAEQIRLAASKDSTIINEDWKGEGY